VASILAQMSCDSVGTSFFARRSSLDGIGLNTAPSLPQCSDVIDIDVQPLLLCVCCHSP
jgi:hypothetical protein